MFTPGAEKFELDWLKRWHCYTPNAVAIECADTGRIFTYGKFFERAVALAAALKQRYGIEPGDRVAILAHNEPEHFILFFALQRLGAMLVPVNFRFAAREVDHVLQDSGAKLFIHQEAFAANVGKLGVKPLHDLPFADLQRLITDSKFAGATEMHRDPNQPVMILYTSGTTGAPKGALITHKMLFWNSVNTGLRLTITNSDCSVIFHPLFHTSGWNVLSTPYIHHGARLVMLKKFDPARVLALCEEKRATILFGVPTMMDMMRRAPNFEAAAFPAMRYAIVGGEPMPVELIRTWAKKNVPIRQGFGITEFGPNIFSLEAADGIRKMGSIGFPNFYVDVKVVNKEGREVTEPGEVGELLLRGPVCTPGYWQNEAATAEAIQNNWFHSGDLVRFDSDGYFYVVGRKKEMFISGAENIYPAEIETYLRAMTGIREVAVIGVPDAKWGEVGKCFYATETGEPLEPEKLMAYCLDGLAKYKIPKNFVHLKELPKGHSGKIQRRDLPI
jgi:fatty-acyl-CoA synthase